MNFRYAIPMFEVILLALLFVACGPVPVPDTANPNLTLTNTPAQNISVSITSLFDGAEIPYTIDISGEYQNVPQDQEIWLYVYATYIKKYFLLPIDRLNNGTWQVRNIIIGEPNEIDTKYKIGVIAVDLADNDRLESDPFELSVLPSSTQKLIEYTVYRK